MSQIMRPENHAMICKPSDNKNIKPTDILKLEFLKRKFKNFLFELLTSVFKVTGYGN